MIIPLTAMPLKTKAILVFTVLATVLSWMGNLDRYSEDYLDKALISGGLVYATARGINAAVSVLQGTEITPAVATFTVGEVLDPVNDLIERFSAILLMALGSMALQKIMLEIFSHEGFSIAVTILALSVFCTACSGRLAPWFNLALRLFFLTIALRFALALVVLASAAVDQVFLQQADLERHSEMTRLERELRVLGDTTPGVATAEELAQAEAELSALRDLQSEQQGSVDRLKAQLDALNVELNRVRGDVPLACRLNPWCDEGELVNAKKGDIIARNAELTAAEKARESTESSIVEKREYLQCARQAQSGEPCSFWGRAYSWISPTAWVDRFSRIGDQMDDYANNIITLLMSFIAKTVLIPLFFLYSVIQLYKLVLRNWY